jgi:hypothetical protein
MNNEVKAVRGLTFAKDDAAGVEMGTHRAVGEQSNMPVAHANEKRVCGDLFFKLSAFWSNPLVFVFVHIAISWLFSMKWRLKLTSA